MHCSPGYSFLTPEDPGSTKVLASAVVFWIVSKPILRWLSLAHSPHLVLWETAQAPSFKMYYLLLLDVSERIFIGTSCCIYITTLSLFLLNFPIWL